MDKLTPTIRFLLVRLHIESLEAEDLLEDVRKKLETFRCNIDDKYQDIMQRISRQTLSRQTIATNALAWITHARRPLLIEELRHALAVSLEDQQFKPGRQPRVEDIIAFSCGMVVIEPSSKTFRLLHTTARTFMERLREGDERFTNFHNTIARVCGTYLGMPVLEQPDDSDRGISYATDLWDHPYKYGEQDLYKIQCSGQVGTSDEQIPDKFSFHTKIRIFPLAQYAAVNLGYHLRAMQDLNSIPAKDALDKAAAVLSHRSKRKFYERVLHETESYPPHVLEHQTLGGHQYSRWDSGSEENSDDDWDESPGDSGASEESNQVQFIPPEEPSREITSLHLAAQIGIPQLVTVFLHDQSLLRVRDYSGFTPLGIALCSGHPDVVLILLQTGATLDLSSMEGCRLLLFAAQSDSRADQVVRHILKQSLIISDKERNFIVELFCWLWVLAVTKALYYGSRFLQRCQGGGPWVRVQPTKEALALTFSKLEPSSSRPPDMEPPNPVPPNRVQFTSLPADTRKSSLAVPRKCLARTYSEAVLPPKKQQQRHHLKLVAAAFQNDCRKIASLIDAGKVILHNRPGRQPCHALLINLALFLAIEHDQIEAVRMLIKGGVPINSRDYNDRTPLHRAVVRKSVAMVTFLVNEEAEVNAKDCKGETPWVLATRMRDDASECPVSRTFLYFVLITYHHSVQATCRVWRRRQHAGSGWGASAVPSCSDREYERREVPTPAGC